VLASVFNAVLNKISGQEDITLGIPIANRNFIEVENIIGFFVNTLVLRSQVKSNLTFRELIKILEKNALEAYENQDIPFEYLVDKLDVERRLNVNPLFQIMFILQNNQKEELKFNKIRSKDIGMAKNLSKFDLTLSITETTKGLYVVYEYSTDLFNESEIKEIHGYYIEFIKNILKNQDTRLSSVNILNKQNLKKLNSFNRKLKKRRHINILDNFMKNVRKYPNVLNRLNIRHGTKNCQDESEI
jgi:non-ribosomal peptide synthetase component F